MLETLARAAATAGSPRDLRAAFRLTCSEGAIISEIAGPLGSLSQPIARLLDAAERDPPLGRGAVKAPRGAGGTLFCSIDPCGDGIGVTGDRASADAAADLVASASIATVCIATPAGTGFVDALRERRIAVYPQLCAGEAILLNEAPIVVARRGTPFVHLFALQSVDGRAIPFEEAPAEAREIRGELARRYEGLRGPAGEDLPAIVSNAAWDRLSVITIPQVRGSGQEVIGDLGVREMSEVRRLQNSAWWAGAGAVVFTGYRDLVETFGEGLARYIGDTEPFPLVAKPVAKPAGASGFRDTGVLAALGYHRPNS
ncbi:MAG: hypothetical protein GVY29_05665 [Spirochaetes bacterium]|jgi:hypothetical protein|nr:hypothetical protein [Spirochaetota bacterium]